MFIPFPETSFDGAGYDDGSGRFSSEKEVEIEIQFPCKPLRPLLPSRHDLQVRAITFRRGPDGKREFSEAWPEGRTCHANLFSIEAAILPLDMKLPVLRKGDFLSIRLRNLSQSFSRFDGGGWVVEPLEDR